MLLAHRGQCAHGHLHRGQRKTIGLVGVRHLGIHRGPPVHRGHIVQSHLTGTRAGCYRQVNVSGPLRGKCRMKIWQWLQVDSTPAPVVKRLGDRVLHRVIGTNINVKAIGNLSQGPPQQDILEILSVSNKFHESESKQEKTACAPTPHKTTVPTSAFQLKQPHRITDHQGAQLAPPCSR